MKNALLLLCLLLSMSMALILLVFGNQPTLKNRLELTPEQIAKAKRVFDRNDPRRLRPGALARANLGQQELDIALNYVVNQYLDGAANLNIEFGKARMMATLPLPNNPLGQYVNLEVNFNQTATLPTISSMKIGHLPLPGFIAEGLIEHGFRSALTAIDWQQLTHLVKNVSFFPRRLIVTYQWQSNLPTRFSSVFLSAQERAQIQIYQKRLTELTQTGNGPINLTDLLQPLFELAATRSKHNNAIQENRALIRVLAFYVNQKDLGKLINKHKSWPKPTWRRVNLQKREDFSKHYLVSALLAADAGSPLANAVGLYKEIQDSRGGSGFSFNDIAADRAGTRMGEIAIADEQTAKALQTLLAKATESDIMPDTADLPEFLSEAEFIDRYGGLNGDAYKNTMNKIERRIAALAINRL